MAKLTPISSSEDESYKNNKKQNNKIKKPPPPRYSSNYSDDSDEEYDVTFNKKQSFYTDISMNDEKKVKKKKKNKKENSDYCSYHDSLKSRHNNEDLESDSQTSNDDITDDEYDSDDEDYFIRNREINEKNGNNIFQSDYLKRQLVKNIPSSYKNLIGESYDNTLVDSDQEQQNQTPNNTINNKKKFDKIEIKFNNKSYSLNYEPTCQEDNLFQKHSKTNTNSKNTSDKPKTKQQQLQTQEEGYGNYYNDYIPTFKETKNQDDINDFIKHSHYYKKRDLIPTFKRNTEIKSCLPYIQNPNDCFHPLYREVEQGMHWCDNRSLLINKLLKQKISTSKSNKQIQQQQQQHPLIACKDHSICKRLNELFQNNNSYISQNRYQCWQDSASSDTEDEKRIQEIKFTKTTTSKKTTATSSSSSSSSNNSGFGVIDYSDDSENEGPSFGDSPYVQKTVVPPSTAPPKIKKSPNGQDGSDQENDDPGCKNQ